MNRISLAGATLALAGLATAGIVVGTNPSSAGTALAAATLLSTPQSMTLAPQSLQDSAAAQSKLLADKALHAELARIEAAKRAAAARAAAARAAASRAAAARAAAARAAVTRASRSTTRTPIYSGNARGIALAMLPSFGWGSEQMSCLDPLWSHESGWRVNAGNASGAYGIPQALPGSKMAAYGSDWQTNPRTQITWGLHYIQGRYGNPCGAWAHFQSYGWY